MALANTTRSKRINLRLSEAAKRRIEQAASVEGKTVSAFIVSSALENAEKTVRRHDTIALDRKDAIRFFDALAKPPAPNDKLRAALEGTRSARRIAVTDPGALVVEPLGKPLDRKTFSCGLPELDRYLSRQAGQDVRRRIARVFVCTAADGDAVLGFYTFSALSIELSALPEELSRKLPLHPVPCVLLGRLAVDRSVHGHGVGRMLLADAVRRVVTAGETVAMYAMIVDAANDDAKRFYEGFGFMPVADGPMQLFLPLGHAALRGQAE